MGGESAENWGPTINGSLSNNLFDRYLVAHLSALQRKIKEGNEPAGQIRPIIIMIINLLLSLPYLGLFRHPDRQRRRRGTSCHSIIIAHSDTMIRSSLTHLSGLLVYDLHTIIDNFSSAVPVGFDR